jgi:hypothetical protein
LSWSLLTSAATRLKAAQPQEQPPVAFVPSHGCGVHFPIRRKKTAVTVSRSTCVKVETKSLPTVAKP